MARRAHRASWLEILVIHEISLPEGIFRRIFRWCIPVEMICITHNHYDTVTQRSMCAEREAQSLQYGSELVASGPLLTLVLRTLDRASRRHDAPTV